MIWRYRERYPKPDPMPAPRREGIAWWVCLAALAGLAATIWCGR